MSLRSMTGRELKQAYIDFFVARDHREIAQAPLVPEVVEDVVGDLEHEPGLERL